MKILSMDLNGKDINFGCRCCNASFNLESREDFFIHWVYKPIDREGRIDRNIKIPEYSIKCPVCGYETYIGVDPTDCGEDYNEVIMLGVYAGIIFNREDWLERYKTEVRIIG